MIIQIRIHLDWQDIAVASLEAIINTYNTLFIPTFSFYKGYKPAAIIQQKSNNTYIGVQLENGIVIPGKAVAELPQAVKDMNIKVIQIEEFEWIINKNITMKGGPREMQQIPGFASTAKQLEEIYQHFRIAVAGWLASPETGVLRKRVEGVILRSDLPGYEKRKRLEFIIGTLFYNWFYEDEEAFELPPTFLRSDCRQITSEDKCTGACRWVADGSQGSCRIHIPKDVQYDKRTVSAMELFRGRIIEELVNFYERRKQLMNNHVSRLSGLTGAIQYGDQWIIPERSLTWTELLRLDWATGGEAIEAPRFYEEKAIEADEIAEQTQKQSLYSIPISAADIMGVPLDKLGLLPYKLYMPSPTSGITPLQAYMPILSIALEEMGLTTESATFTQESLNAFASIRQKTIIVIRPASNEIMVGRGSLRPADAYIFLDMGDSIGLLVYSPTIYTVKVSDLPGKLINAIRLASIATAAKTAVSKTVAPAAAPPTRRIKIIRR